MKDELSHKSIQSLRLLVKDYALGTYKSNAELIDHFDLPDDTEVEELLLDVSVERCPTCEWWFESGDLVSDESDEIMCDDCRSEWQKQKFEVD